MNSDGLFYEKLRGKNWRYIQSKSKFKSSLRVPTYLLLLLFNLEPLTKLRKSLIEDNQNSLLMQQV